MPRRFRVALAGCPGMGRQLGKERGWGHRAKLQQQHPSLPPSCQESFKPVGEELEYLGKLQWEQQLLMGAHLGGGHFVPSSV